MIETNMIGLIAEAPVGKFLLDRRDSFRHVRRTRSARRVLEMFDSVRVGSAPLVGARLLPTGNDVAVLAALLDDDPVIVKLALSPTANGGLVRHTEMLAALAPLDLFDRIPRLLESGVVDVGGGCRYVVESAFPGSVLTVHADSLVVGSALELVSSVHERSAGSTVLSIDDVDALVDPHIAALTAAGLASWRVAALDHIRAVLRASLVGRELSLSITHGDCWPGNVMGAIDGRGQWRARGLIDWENGALRGLPEIDLAHYLLAMHPQGPVAAVLDGLGNPMQVIEHRMAPFGPVAANPDLPASLCTVLAWLNHVGAGVSRAERFGPGRAWMSNVVAPVLDAVADGDTLWRRGARHWAIGGAR
jgi:hypothetical protein